MIVPTNQSEELTFGGNPDPDTDPDHFPLPSPCYRIGDFRIFISIYDTVTLGEITDADKIMNT